VLLGGFQVGRQALGIAMVEHRTHEGAAHGLALVPNVARYQCGSCGCIPSIRFSRRKVADMELLLPAPGTALRAEIDSATGPARVVLRPAMEIDGVRTIASLVFDGYGPAILPATAVPGHLRGSFVGIPVEGLPRRHVGVAQRRRGLPSAPVRAVIDVLGLVVNDPLSMPEGIHPT